MMEEQQQTNEEQTNEEQPTEEPKKQKSKLSREEWSMDELSTHVLNTKRVDKDFLIITDGATGGGKSTWSIKFAKKNDSKFNIEKDVVFSQDEFIDKVVNSEAGRTYIADEAINVLFRRDFMLKKQKFILRLLDMARDKNLCLIFCVPNFWAIDKHLLEGRIKLRVHIAKTGLAFLWKPSSNPFAPDKWYRKYNEIVSSNWDYYMNARRTKGFLGFIRFGDMCNSDKEIYLKVKKEKKEMIAQQEKEKEANEDKEKQFGYKLGEINMLYTLREQGLLKQGAITVLASLKGVSQQVLTNRMRRLKQNEKNKDILLNNSGKRDYFDELDT
ncbi:MAG TPA: hypothetical protein VMZ91_11460 [Candidatus Paceibacterota bacterium]|nr:hypothetical protein [Candidatus Paceibacterota bacterium]